MAKSDEIPEWCHFREEIFKEFAMEFSQEGLKLLAYMFNSTPVKQYKVENFCTFANIFLPLCESATSGLSLRAQILKKT